MADVLDVNSVVIPLNSTDWAGDDVSMRVLRSPDLEQGGGITIIGAYVVNEAATGAGTAFSLSLQNFGTGGTAVAGTISTVGGTADPFAAGVPKSFEITNGYLAPGEWLVVNKREDNSSDPTRGVLVIQYLMGR